MADKQVRKRSGGTVRGGAKAAVSGNSGRGRSSQTAGAKRSGSTRSASGTGKQYAAGNGKTKKRTTAGSGRKQAKQVIRTARSSGAGREMIDYSLAWEIAAWVVIAVSVILFISTLGLGGSLGKAFAKVDFGLFGVMAYIFPFALFFLAAFFISNRSSVVARMMMLGWVLLFVTLCCVLQLILVGYNESYTLSEYYEASALYRTGGGLVGGAMTAFFANGIGVVGTWIVCVMLLIISLILITQRSLFSGVKRGGSAIARTAREKKARSLDALRRFRKERESALQEMNDSDTLYDPETDETTEETEDDFGWEAGGFSILPKEKRLDRPARGVTGATTLSPQIPDHSADADVQIGQDQPEKAGSGKGNSARKQVSTAQGAADDMDSIFSPDLKIRGLETMSAPDRREGTDQAQSREEEKAVPVRPASASKRKPVDMGGSIFSSRNDKTVATSSGKVASSGTAALGSDPEKTTEKDMREAARKADEMIGRGQGDSGQAPARSSGTGNSAGAGAASSAGGRRPHASEQEIAEGVSQVAGEIAMGETVVKKEYVFPTTDLLNETRSKGGITEEELRETAARLAQVFKTFGVNVKITDVTCGPSVTRYELTPEMGVKVSKIVSLQNDIMLNMAVTDIRIEAPIPGKSAVGIEVPNKKPSSVGLRELLESGEFRKHKSSLAYVVGKDIGGNIIVSDIAKMPHLLIAGATGSGKSVFINTLIMSILFKAKPEDVKLIMIDPKVVELSVYNGIPHLFIPVVTDPKKAAGALNWAVAEMMARYQKFADTGVRDLKGYNAKIASLGDDVPEETKPQKLPQIVIIVDELADLMMVASSEVEDAICRLAQLARAAGIHLVIATQRPSVDVITGLIKANMPSRIAFSVSSGVDSRTILDQVGAEKLLGNGDMFFSPQTYKQPLRVQGAFVSDEEVAEVVEYLKQENGDTAADRKMAERMEQVAKSVSVSSQAGGGSDRDELFVDAGRFVIEKDKATIGMLQRWFKIGFNRAARIMDQLSEAGVVGPEEGTKPRKVEMSMEQFENYLEQNG